MASERNRATFWDWWAGSQEALIADVSEDPDAPGILGRLLRRFRGDAGRGLKAALQDVDEMLADIHPGIVSDFGPHGWVFSALGDREAYTELMQLMRACPREVSDPPMAGAPRHRLETVSAGKHTLHRSQLRFVVVLRENGLILGVVADAPEEIPPEDLRNAVGRFVVAELGERTAVRLAEWRVIGQDSQSAQSSRPFDELSPRISELLDGDGSGALFETP